MEMTIKEAKKLQKRIDTSYLNVKQLPTLVGLSIIVPILLPIAFGLGFLYNFNRKKLLKFIDNDSTGVPVGLLQAQVGDLNYAEKIQYIRDKGWRLRLPILIVGILIVLVGLVGLSLNFSS